MCRSAQFKCICEWDFFFIRKKNMFCKYSRLSKTFNLKSYFKKKMFCVYYLKSYIFEKFRANCKLCFSRSLYFVCRC